MNISVAENTLIARTIIHMVVLEQALDLGLGLGLGLGLVILVFEIERTS